MHWLSKKWWQYLFAPAEDPHYASTLRRVWCRMRGHPSGPVWYTMSGLEPNMHCKNCGDLIY